MTRSSPLRTRLRVICSPLSGELPLYLKLRPTQGPSREPYPLKLSHGDFHQGRRSESFSNDSICVTMASRATRFSSPRSLEIHVLASPPRPPLQEKEMARASPTPLPAPTGNRLSPLIPT